VKPGSLYRVDLRRLALSKFTWAAAILSLCGPALGLLGFFRGYGSALASNQYILNPLNAATVSGALVWAVLSLLEADRVSRNKTDVLIDAIAPPAAMAVVRLASVITLSALVCILCFLVYLPYTIVKMDYLFSFTLYARSFIAVMLPTWWISILIACALYQITKRLELAGLLFAVCVYFSFSRFVANDFFPRWLNPLIVTYSDGFSSLHYLRIAFYTRVMWLFLAGGFWTLSLLCVRRFQKNLAGSFLQNFKQYAGVKKVYTPAVSAALLVIGILLWTVQPFVDHGSVDSGFRFSDEAVNKVFNSDSANNTVASNFTYRITALPATGQINGLMEYTISEPGSKEISIWINCGYKVRGITYGDKAIDFKTGMEVLLDSRRTWFTLPESASLNGGGQILRIEFHGYPTMLRCFLPYSWGQEITRQNVSLTNGATVQSVTGISAPETSTFRLVLPVGLQPIVNHKMMSDFKNNNNGTMTWTTEIQSPPSRSPSIWLAAASYKTETFHAGGIDIDFIYRKKYEKIMKEYSNTGARADVFNYCTEHFGSLKWAGDRNLMMLQRSEISGGGNAGPGWVEWSEYIFTPGNLNDPFKGANASEVFVHEIIHQWWGGLGVSCGYEWEGNGLWSEEGLTVYSTYRLLKDKYGEEYAGKNYIDVWQAAVDIQERSFYYRNPEYLDRLPERYRAGLADGFRSTNLYARMPLMILKAQQLVGGEEKMDEILREVQEEYAGTGTAFTYEAFLERCGLTEEDLKIDKNS
jgi:hypothetical protein